MQTHPGTDDSNDVARVLDERARRMAVPVEAPTHDGTPHLVVGVRSHQVALPMSVLRRVVAPPPVTRVPNQSASVVGIAAVPGGLVPVIDLARLLQIDEPELVAEQSLLVIEDGEDQLGLLVDGVQGQTTLEPQETQAGSASVQAAPLVAPARGGGLLVLDVDAALADPRLSTFGA